MRQQKRHKKSFSLKDSIFVKDGNYTFFIPVSILVILVLASWSWIFLAIPPVSNIAESVIAKNFNQGRNDAVADKDMQGSDSPINDIPITDAPESSTDLTDDTTGSQEINSNPKITGITFSSDSVYKSESYEISAEATDPEGQQLTYKWTVSAGLLEGSNASSVKWTAPQNPGNCEIKVEVADPLGAKDIKTVTVNVLEVQNDKEDDSQSQETQTIQPEQDTSSAQPVRKIVFVSSMAGNEDIWSMNIDGTDLTQLTDGPGREMYPSISPDGKKIAYSVVIGTTWQIFTMNWDGSGKKQITNRPYRHGYHAWSFDGRFIYFGLYIDNSWDVFVMESDGSNTRRLTTNPQLDNWHPYSHPFEYKIVYESGFTGNEEIWEMGLDGQNNNKISKGGINYRAPKYSIDGNKIAFMGRDRNNIEQIFIMDSNGENVVQLTDGPEGARLPCFSPDNRLIVYNTLAAGGNIFIMNIDGSQKIQLTNTPGSDWGAVFMHH